MPNYSAVLTYTNRMLVWMHLLASTWIDVRWRTGKCGTTADEWL